MRKVLSEMSGLLNEAAIKDGMKSDDWKYDFSKCEVKCWVTITEEGIETEFSVYPKYFSHQLLFSTNSFKELRSWLEEHKEEIE